MPSVVAMIALPQSILFHIILIISGLLFWAIAIFTALVTLHTQHAKLLGGAHTQMWLQFSLQPAWRHSYQDWKLLYHLYQHQLKVCYWLIVSWNTSMEVAEWHLIAHLRDGLCWMCMRRISGCAQYHFTEIAMIYFINDLCHVVVHITDILKLDDTMAVHILQWNQHQLWSVPRGESLQMCLYLISNSIVLQLSTLCPAGLSI